MGIYIFVIILLIYLIIKYDFRINSSHKDLIFRNYWVNFLLLVFICIPTFSYKMGGDTMVYQNWFESELSTIDKFSFSDSRWEPLFVLLMSFVKTISNVWIFAHFIIIAFINCSVFSFAKRYVNNIFLFLLLYFVAYFYEYNFEPLRQSIAIGVFLYSLKFLENNSLLNFYVTITLAACFHFTALIAFIIPFLKRINYNFWVCVFLVVIAVSGTFINIYFQDALMQISFFTEGEAYSYYLGSDYIENKLNFVGVIFSIMIKVFPVLISYYLVKRADVKTFPYINCLSLLFIVMVLLSTSVPILHRLSQFFGIFQIALYSDVLFFNKKILSNIQPYCLSILRILIILTVSVNMYTYYNASNQYGLKNYQRCVPYTSIFTKKADPVRQKYLDL